jgi:hypothetical protein
MYIEDTFEVYWRYFECISKIHSRYIGDTSNVYQRYFRGILEILRMYIKDTFEVYWRYFECISKILSRYIGDTFEAAGGGSDGYSRLLELRRGSFGALGRDLLPTSE